MSRLKLFLLTIVQFLKCESSYQPQGLDAGRSFLANGLALYEALVCCYLIIVLLAKQNSFCSKLIAAFGLAVSMLTLYMAEQHYHFGLVCGSLFVWVPLSCSQAILGQWGLGSHISLSYFRAVLGQLGFREPLLPRVGFLQFRI